MRRTASLLLLTLASILAMKYLDEDGRKSYLEWRSAMKEPGSDPR